MSNLGQEFVLVGLSEANLTMMKAGQPVSIGPIPKDPVLGNTTIIIITGENEADMVNTLRQLGIHTEGQE